MAMISTLRLGLPFALLVLLAGSAAAAPFDGPRWEEFGGERYPLHVVPGAISVTWAPGVVATWPEDAPPLGPDTLRVDGVDFVRVGAIGGNRFFTERYDARAPLDAEGTATVARALLSHPDVQVASPLWATSPTDHADPWAVTDQVLLQLSDPAGESAMRTLAASMGITTLRERGLAPHQWLLKIPQNAAVDPIEAAMTLEAAPFVRWAEVDWLVPMYERYVPADPGYADQWHLNNTGQQGGLVDADMDVQEAWDLTLGDVDVIVSAQDSGVDVDHPDLVQDLLPGYDFVNGDTDPSGSSHGTSVAGCMAAPENGEGVVGVCPLCKILPLRVIGASNSAQADAHDFSVTNGAAVINNSWGPSDNADPSTPQPIPDVVATAVESAVATGRDGKGVAIFWAGGNGHNNGQTCSQDGYVSHPDTIGVGASTNMAERSGYSERCPELELSGPSTGGSTGIHTTNNNGYTYTFGGTSAASPNTAGVAALVLSALPELTFDELRELLWTTADKIDPGDADYDANGHSLSYGYGRVNALEALEGEVATLTIPTGLQRCDATLDLAVSIPTTPGLGTITVDAWSDSENSVAEVVTLTETTDGLYEGSVQLTDAAVVGGDGLVSVVTGDRVFVSSEDADALKSVSVDCEGPVLSAFEVRDITPDSAVIYWETNEHADGEASWDGGSGDDPIVDLDHLVVALNLTPCTNYTATLSSTDLAGYTGTVENAVSWRAPGDPLILPDDALEDADPCDESTWYEPETPTPGDDDDATNGGRDPGGFEGQGCGGCSGSGSFSALLFGALLMPRRRRRA